MSFSSEWLSLREPIDHRARNRKVLSAVAHHLNDKKKLNITDIGSGTGSTIRALKPVLGQKLSWHLIDNDDGLIEIAKEHAGDDDVSVTLVDLSKSIDAVFEKSPDIITTSAFLDLVSQDWLFKLAREITDRKLPFYAALTYDGRAGCMPPLDGDEKMVAVFNEHQKNNKGFGPALGPDAVDVAVRVFNDFGYTVVIERSDWEGRPEDKAFQKMLLDGWFTAASQIKPDRIHTFKEWLANRYRLIDESESSVLVGHSDLLAFPRD